ncbi:GNAT family N-acetyltransferase [Flavobacterium sp. ZS1P14]|uniref:GNAT family N-acetyltransferase n=1 Tax=Flavobacterium sp. ZS1P14 TaxID=3401729 RepID=UPI003AAEB662
MKDFLNKQIQLENNRVLLIPFLDKKSEELRTIIFDNDIWEYMGMYISTENDFNNYIKDTLEKHSKTAYSFLIIDKLTNEIAGSTSFGNINFKSEKLEIGWTWYGKKFQGTGLNKACKLELLKYGFEQIGLRRIQFSADLENIKSQKAIEKLGATQEGIFRNNYIDSLGNSKNDVYYSIIKEDWKNIKERYFSEYL